MKISDIYKKYGVSPNLQEHMYRVCGIVFFIEEHWKGSRKIDWELTKKMALIHDLGNIVKYDIDNHPEFLGSEQGHSERWKKLQNQMVKKYGADDNEATRRMLTELGIDPKIVNDIYNKRFMNSTNTAKSDNLPLKILYYADLRVLPLGIGTLKERIDDIRERYNPVYTERPDFEDQVNACWNIEKEIQENLGVPVSDITDKSIDLQLVESDFNNLAV